VAIRSAGRRYTISLLVRYNANLELRSFYYTVAGVSKSFSLRATLAGADTGGDAGDAYPH